MTEPYIKLCNRCKIKKPENEYGVDRRANDGMRVYCKICTNELRKITYQRHKVKVREKQKLRYHNKEKIRLNEKAQLKAAKKLIQCVYDANVIDEKHYLFKEWLSNNKSI